MPKLSVIIVTWNSGKDIVNCLDSVFAQYISDSEVVVIDNDSRDDTAALLEKQSGQLRVVFNPANAGFAKAVNQGLGMTSGEYLLLLNPDTVVQPSAFDLMLSYMEANPLVGALGPQLLNTDGTIQPSCREFPRPAHLFYEFTGLSRLFPRHPKFGSWRMGYFDHQRQCEVDQPMGACLMLRRSAVEQIGPMDEINFPMFLNDVDWCYRLKQNRWKIVFFPDAKVVHLQGVSINMARLAMTVTSHRSLAAFFTKHYGRGPSTIMAKLSLLLTMPLRLTFQYLSKRSKGF